MCLLCIFWRYVCERMKEKVVQSNENPPILRADRLPHCEKTPSCRIPTVTACSALSLYSCVNGYF